MIVDTWWRRVVKIHCSFSWLSNRSITRISEPYLEYFNIFGGFVICNIHTSDGGVWIGIKLYITVWDRLKVIQGST